MITYVDLTAQPHLLAQVIKGALEAEGVRVRLLRDGLGAVYGLDSGSFATRIQVAEEDLPAARALLEEVARGEDR